MNKKQATELSTFVHKKMFGYKLLIYDDIQHWGVDNEHSECNFHFGFNYYTTGEIEMAVSMKHLYNKPSDCPIIITFPETKKEWNDLGRAMLKLRGDAYPDYCFKQGFLLNKRLVNKE